MKRFLIFKLPPYALTVVCAAAILYLTIVPRPLPDSDMALIPGMDKIVHGVMFFGLALCIAVDWRRGRLKQSPARRVGLESDNRRDKMPLKRFIPQIVSSASGGVIEIVQMTMGLGRSGDVLDFAADTVGAFASLLVIPGVFTWLSGCVSETNK